MAGTIVSGTYTSFISLYNPATQRPVTVTGKITNASGQGIIGDFDFAWTVNNQGTVESISATAGFGIQLLDGGTVNNAAGGLVAGYQQAILIEFAPGTVSNLGRIESPGTSGTGVDLFQTGGEVSNGSPAVTTALISGGGNGIVINGGIGAVTNFGTIESANHTTIRLDTGGSVSNGSAASTHALIANTGSSAGVYIGYGAGTVTNFGTIKGASSGVVLLDGGSVANGRSGSTAGFISGSNGDGIDVVSGAGTIANFGTIQETIDSGIALHAGGTVTNGAVAAATALITGTGSGIFFNGAPGTVTNFGKILITSATSGTALTLEDGGSVTNFGTIQNTNPSNAGIYFHAGGSVTNSRTGASVGLISGAGNAVSIRGGPGRVVNSASIQSVAGSGVYLNSGSVINQAGGVIAGHSDGIYNRHAAISVSNSGLIESTGTLDGIYLKGGGSVTNNAGATIAGSAGGIALGQLGGSISNSGIIKGLVGLYGGANNSGNVTLVNFGTIASTSTTTDAVAIQMGNNHGSKLLVVEKSAVFKGLVQGGGRGEIKFAATGIAAMGANISGFETVALANGGADTLTLRQANLGGVSSDRITVIGGNDGNTVNASAMTGGDVTIEGGAGKDVLTGNANGGAIFVFTAATLTASDKITGSGFNNELEMTTAGTVVASGVDAVEIYRLADGGANSLTLANNNFNALPGSTVDVYGGNKGNKIDGSSLAAGHNLVIYGGSGTDVLKGGAGNDVFVMGNTTLSGDTVSGGGGYDELQMTIHASLSAAKVSGVETYVLGDGGANILTLISANFAGLAGGAITVSDGDGGNIVGLAASVPAADHIVVYAGTGVDKLTGGAGGDTFFAGGKTTMTGKAGANQFTFSAPGSNTVTDFAASSANTLMFISDSGFSLPGAGATPKSLGALFTTGAFTKSSQRFAYTGGKLFYSATGSSSNEKLVATLAGSPTLNPAHLLFMS